MSCTCIVRAYGQVDKSALRETVPYRIYDRCESRSAISFALVLVIDQKTVEPETPIC